MKKLIFFIPALFLLSAHGQIALEKVSNSYGVFPQKISATEEVYPVALSSSIEIYDSEHQLIKTIPHVFPKYLLSMYQGFCSIQMRILKY